MRAGVPKERNSLSGGLELYATQIWIWIYGDGYMDIWTPMVYPDPCICIYIYIVFLFNTLTFLIVQGIYVFLAEAIFSMCRPKCDYQTDRTERGIISRVSGKQHMC